MSRRSSGTTRGLTSSSRAIEDPRDLPLTLVGVDDIGVTMPRKYFDHMESVQQYLLEFPLAKEIPVHASGADIQHLVDFVQLHENASGTGYDYDAYREHGTTLGDKDKSFFKDLELDDAFSSTIASSYLVFRPYEKAATRYWASILSKELAD